MVALFSALFFTFYGLSSSLFFYSYFYKSFMLDFYIFEIGGVDFSFCFVLDFLSAGFFSCVSFISGVVFSYSIFYMEGTVDMRRFCWLVLLFVVSMMLLVFSGNFILVMVGWDGLGLVSFCLVIFYANSSSLESGLVTVFSNRIGDVFFLASFPFFFGCGWMSWDFFSFLNVPYIFLFFIFLGSITKSAQVPFSAWLPAAMAAPTPVSSLVHSSTLVTAGVYVLIRFNYLFYFFSMSVFKCFFVFTMVLAGACAIVETDFKKIVAMSTLSQLGMMMFILSVGSWVLSFIHMIVHAFFKSMLFLSTGGVMGQMGGTQDSRFYGGLFSNFSCYLYFFVSCFCLSGFPFFLGFYSKDFIISGSSFQEGLLLYVSFLLGCIFTVMYSIRLLYQSYFLNFKYSVFSECVEKVFFFVPVMLLFFKCWLLGGCLYWFFLCKMGLFFTFFDLFAGLLLFFVGIFFYLFMRFLLFSIFSLGSIFYLRWTSGGGSSFLFNFLEYSKFELTWMELSGGMGAYKTLSSASSSFNVFGRIGIGSLIFLCLVACIYSFLYF